MAAALQVCPCLLPLDGEQVLDIKSVNATSIPCIVDSGVRVFDRAIHQLHASERLWKSVSTWVFHGEEA